MSFRDVFLSCTKQAEEYMAKMQGGEYHDLEEFSHLFRGYILKKCLLEDDCITDRLSNLLDESIKKVLELAGGDGFDLSDNKTCTGSSSKIEKKLLMLTKLKKDLGLEIGIDQLVAYDTVTNLSKKIYELLEKGG